MIPRTVSTVTVTKVVSPVAAFDTSSIEQLPDTIESLQQLIIKPLTGEVPLGQSVVENIQPYTEVKIRTPDGIKEAVVGDQSTTDTLELTIMDGKYEKVIISPKQYDTMDTPHKRLLRYPKQMTAIALTEQQAGIWWSLDPKQYDGHNILLPRAFDLIDEDRYVHLTRRDGTEAFGHVVLMEAKENKDKVVQVELNDESIDEVDVLKRVKEWRATTNGKTGAWTKLTTAEQLFQIPTNTSIEVYVTASLNSKTILDGVLIEIQLGDIRFIRVRLSEQVIVSKHKLATDRTVIDRVRVPTSVLKLWWSFQGGVVFSSLSSLNTRPLSWF